MTETVANPTTSVPPNSAPPASGPAVPPVPSVRRGGDYQSMRSAQGPLQELPGRWVGRGFNLIARPDFAARSVPPGPGDKSALFLELNFTNETLKFDSIGSPIPNRGFDQNDIELHGVHYLQQIADLNTGGALHLEPGIWINIPKTTEPFETASVARMASIPHGTVLLAEGTGFTIPGGPRIQPANTVPFAVNGPQPSPGTTNHFPEYSLTAPAPAPTFRTPAGQVPGLTQQIIDDPNSILLSDIRGQNIVETTVLQIASVPSLSVLGVAAATGNGSAPPASATPPPVTTQPIPDGGGGTENIPFLLTNATAQKVFATFWIEKVQDPDYPGRYYMQLQYTQTVLLNFPIDVPKSPANPTGLVNLSWPHVSVATLVKEF